MGKRNSKLKQDTIDKLLADTYCKYVITNILSYDISVFFYRRVYLLLLFVSKIEI